MESVENYLFHNASYRMFRAVASVLERFVAYAPKPVPIQQLVNEIELTGLEIRKACSSLYTMGLIDVAEDQKSWSLVGEPGTITLHDVLMSVIHGNSKICRNSVSDEISGPASEIDLLIAQALLTIDQNISLHLRTFQLDRVSASRCSPLSYRLGGAI